LERCRRIGHGVDRDGPDIFPGDQAAGGAPRRLELSGGIRNQVEGGIIQSLSWTSREAVRFDATRRTSFDWSSYPILRFSDVPRAIEVHIINRPGSPFLGTGEAAQGPAGAALANALADATGIRLRDLPLSPRRVKAAIGVT